MPECSGRSPRGAISPARSRASWSPPTRRTTCPPRHLPTSRRMSRPTTSRSRSDHEGGRTMAHQIETHGSEAAAIFARTDAWHRLGTTVRDRAFSAEEAMTIGHLGGWRVRKVPLIAHEVTGDSATTIDAPGYATV